MHTPVPLLLRPSSDPGCFARVSSHSGDEDEKFALLDGRWPWVFEQPGRCAEIPAEEVFTGFDGLFDDDTDEDASGASDSYSKVGLQHSFAVLPSRAFTHPVLMLARIYCSAS